MELRGKGLTIRLDLGGIPDLTVLRKEEKKIFTQQNHLLTWNLTQLPVFYLAPPSVGPQLPQGGIWILSETVAVLPTGPVSCPLVSPCLFPTPAGREVSKFATARLLGSQAQSLSSDPDPACHLHCELCYGPRCLYSSVSLSINVG